jgi:sporulation protein YlmC with PRC-barrel domain
MTIADQVINLPVYTQAGIFLGKVVKVEVAPDGQAVQKYIVHSANPLKNLVSGQLVIDASQVISITAEKIIVEDNWQKIIDPALTPSV